MRARRPNTGTFSAAEGLSVGVLVDLLIVAVLLSFWGIDSPTGYLAALLLELAVLVQAGAVVTLAVGLLGSDRSGARRAAALVLSVVVALALVLAALSWSEDASAG